MANGRMFNILGGNWKYYFLCEHLVHILNHFCGVLWVILPHFCWVLPSFPKRGIYSYSKIIGFNFITSLIVDRCLSQLSQELLARNAGNDHNCFSIRTLWSPKGGKNIFLYFSNLSLIQRTLRTFHGILVKPAVILMLPEFLYAVTSYTAPLLS